MGPAKGGSAAAGGLEEGCVSTADNAAADDGQASGDVLHLEKSVGVESVNVVEGNLRGPMGLGAGGDENDFSGQPACSLPFRNGHGMGVQESGLAAHEFDAVEREVFQNALALHVDNFALVVHEIVDGKIFLEGIVDAVEAALLEARKIERRFA